MAYAKENKIPIPVSIEKPYSTDRNLLHISFEGEFLKTHGLGHGGYVYSLCSSEKAPDRPTTIEIDFEDGIPKRIDGQSLSLQNFYRI